jgi:hypothetical protein
MQHKKPSKIPMSAFDTGLLIRLKEQTEQNLKEIKNELRKRGFTV